MIRSPILVASHPPTTAPTGSAPRNHSSRKSVSFWALLSTPWPNSSTLTSVTISAAPVHSEAPSAARNGRNFTPAGSMSLVRANCLPDEERDGRDECAARSGRPQLGKTCLPSGAGLYRPRHHEPQRQRQQHAADDVHLLAAGRRVLCEGRLKWIITIAMTASGTLIQNTSRQVLSSADDRDAVQRAQHAAELLRRADAAQHGGAVALRPTGRRRAPASPAAVRRWPCPGWSRPITIVNTSSDSAVTTEPDREGGQADCSTSLRPNRSDARPSSGMAAM